VAAAVLGGCAQAAPGGTGPGSGDSASTELFPGCRSGTAAVRRADPVARADLDGDGRAETVRATGPRAGGCGDALVVTVQGSTSGVRLAPGGVDPGSIRVVQPPGHDGRLIFVTGRAHPRGGFQPHLVGLAHGMLEEVTVAGEPLLPFVATDGGGQPASADSTTDGGVATLTASTHEPPGIVLAWDLRRTRYTLQGTAARRVSSRMVATAVADPVLRREHPELYRPTFFAGCTVAAGQAGRQHSSAER
jgi:hypothetical protein